MFQKRKKKIPLGTGIPCEKVYCKKKKIKGAKTSKSRLKSSDREKDRGGQTSYNTGCRKKGDNVRKRREQ